MTANNEPAADLTEKDRAFRAFVREENMWKVVFYVCTPLALYQSLNQIFKIFDSMMASHIGASSVSAVAYLSQLNLMLSALGGVLARRRNWGAKGTRISKMPAPRIPQRAKRVLTLRFTSLKSPAP